MNESEVKVSVLSIGWSGSNWLCCILETLLGVKCQQGGKESTPITPTKKNKNKSVYLFKHEKFSSCEEKVPDILIYIIRDYKESVRGKNNSYIYYLQDLKDNLRYFDKFKKPKHLVYYEDLVNKPKETINILTNFLSNYISLNMTPEEFLKNYQNYQKESYKKRKSNSNNVKSIFKKRKPFEYEDILVNDLKNFELYNKYLSHY